jgi:hypothetical protein
MKNILTVFALATALSLSAEVPHFGVQGGVSLPAQDLADNASLGLQLGGHARWNFKHGQTLMARADMTLYDQNNNTNVTTFGVGADYIYHLERRPSGLYLLAGLSNQNYHTSFTNSSRNDSGLGIDLGAGYDLDRHLGLQARYTTHSFNGLTYAALNLGATYTF